MTGLTEAFTLNQNGQQVWKAIVDGEVIPAEFNSKGAAQAAIPVERARRARRAAAASKGSPSMAIGEHFGWGQRPGFTNPQPPVFYDCGICGHLHPVNWDGDCRDDDNRFTADELDSKYGQDGWEEVPMSYVTGIEDDE